MSNCYFELMCLMLISWPFFTWVCLSEIMTRDIYSAFLFVVYLKSPLKIYENGKVEGVLFREKSSFLRQSEDFAGILET